MLKRFRFGLSTVLLLVVCIAAACATWIKRDPWYVSKTVPTGQTYSLAAFEEQDLLACLDPSIPKQLVVRRLSAGEVLHDFDGAPLRVAYLAGNQDQLYGFHWDRLVRIEPTTGESTQLMTPPSTPTESETLIAVAPDGRAVLLVAYQMLESGNVNPSASVTYRVRDVASGDLLWELPTTDTSGTSRGAFSADGQRIGIQGGWGRSFQVWDYGENQQIYDSPLGLSSMEVPILFPDGRRGFADDTIWDLRTGVTARSWGVSTSEAIVRRSSMIHF